jgi:hypothetical protein
MLKLIRVAPYVWLKQHISGASHIQVTATIAKENSSGRLIGYTTRWVSTVEGQSKENAPRIGAGGGINL